MCASIAAGVIESARLRRGALRSGRAAAARGKRQRGERDPHADAKALDIGGMVHPGALVPELRAVEPGPADRQRLAVGPHDAFDQAAARSERAG